MSKKPVVLMVLDGYGLNDRTEGNAIALANAINCFFFILFPPFILLLIPV